MNKVIKQQGWQPIETAPIGQEILVYHKERALIEIKHRTQSCENLMFPGGSSICWYSHWMPLPAAPQEKNDEQTNT